jgi:ubiquinone/menaquinone biosynthesis C-methylase UbiE
MKHGKFDTDISALRQRIECHEKYGSHDLNQWIFDHLELDQGLLILDLGCGTGKQTLPLAQIIGDTGHVFALDISEEALNALYESSKACGVERRITLLHCGLDDLPRHLNEPVFDRVQSCYSLYYAQYPRRVVRQVFRILKTGGVFFFCGPRKDNNLELKQFHYALRSKRVPDEEGTAPKFMEETGQQLAQEFFTKVEIFTFQNPLRFDSAEALYDYWSSYNLYDEKLAADFKVATDKHFETHSIFETVKRVIGVRAVKRSA